MYDNSLISYLGNRCLTKSDAELVESFLAGDCSSFRSLYERHYRMAVAIARGQLIDIHLAEDAAQEAFAEAYRSMHNLQNRAKFASWLGTICRRTALRLARTQPRTQPILDALEPICDSTQPALRAHVHELLGTLEDSARELVMLHYFSGLSYQEIAEILDLTPQAIHGRLQRTRRELREVFQSEESKE